MAIRSGPIFKRVDDEENDVTLAHRQRRVCFCHSSCSPFSPPTLRTLVNLIVYGLFQSSNPRCFSNDGQFALSASWDKTLRLWDLEVGKLSSRRRDFDKSSILGPNIEAIFTFIVCMFIRLVHFHHFVFSFIAITCFLVHISFFLFIPSIQQSNVLVFFFNKQANRPAASKDTPTTFCRSHSLRTIVRLFLDHVTRPSSCGTL